MDTIQAIILAIVEGLTEFLPISSTAHMGFAANLMGMEETEFFKMFSGFNSIRCYFSSCCSFYWKKFLTSKS